MRYGGDWCLGMPCAGFVPAGLVQAMANTEVMGDGIAISLRRASLRDSVLAWYTMGGARGYAVCARAQC